MPTYAYACKSCGHQFDIHQSFTDDALTVCPECSGELRKVISAVGVVFKGSGFYRTDSRSGAKVASVPAESKSDSAGSKDSAPAPAAPAKPKESASAPAKASSTPSA